MNPIVKPNGRINKHQTTIKFMSTLEEGHDVTKAIEELASIMDVDFEQARGYYKFAYKNDLVPNMQAPASDPLIRKNKKKPELDSIKQNNSDKIAMIVQRQAMEQEEDSTKAA